MLHIVPSAGTHAEARLRSEGWEKQEKEGKKWENLKGREEDFFLNSYSDEYKFYTFTVLIRENAGLGLGLGVGFSDLTVIDYISWSRSSFFNLYFML